MGMYFVLAFLTGEKVQGECEVTIAALHYFLWGIRKETCSLSALLGEHSLGSAEFTS